MKASLAESFCAGDKTASGRPTTTSAPRTERKRLQTKPESAVNWPAEDEDKDECCNQRCEEGRGKECVCVCVCVCVNGGE